MRWISVAIEESVWRHKYNRKGMSLHEAKMSWICYCTSKALFSNAVYLHWSVLCGMKMPPRRDIARRAIFQKKFLFEFGLFHCWHYFSTNDVIQLFYYLLSYWLLLSALNRADITIFTFHFIFSFWMVSLSSKRFSILWFDVNWFI